MLVKEYRIPLPMTVEEYRIAQLYMIAKKSRQESSGTESGVEILVNEPYEEGPGGKGGQYTHKVYHVGSHLPSWIKSLMPKNALIVEEEAWNAYPYTKTKFRCPFVDKLSLEVETVYLGDGGHQDNVFGLTDSQLKERVVDLVDVVKDQDIGSFEDSARDDPKCYVSEKTGRGPLSATWIEDTWQDCVRNGHRMPTPNGSAIMCAYKICRVEFKYWGMQTKIERFIHDVALRKTMLKAHSQAWTWQDEWHGLTMEDIREIERKTADLLRKRMDAARIEAEGGSVVGNEYEREIETEEDISTAQSLQNVSNPADTSEDYPKPVFRRKRSLNNTSPDSIPDCSSSVVAAYQNHGTSKNQQQTPHIQSRNSRISMMSSSSSLDEFYDCTESLSTYSISPYPRVEESSEELSRVSSDHRNRYVEKERLILNRSSNENNAFNSSTLSSTSSQSDQINKSDTTHLILVICGGSVFSDEGCSDSSPNNFNHPNIDQISSSTFPALLTSMSRSFHHAETDSTNTKRIIVREINVGVVCSDTHALLSSLSPYSFEGANSRELSEYIPVGAVSLFVAATSSLSYQNCQKQFVMRCNKVYDEVSSTKTSENTDAFISSSLRVSIVADCLGSLVAYDALISSTHDERNEMRLNFSVGDFFTMGSPLGTLLAFRKLQEENINSEGEVTQKSKIRAPPISQIYNLFHASDPCASRLEPLISSTLSCLPPVQVERYHSFNVGHQKSNLSSNSSLLQLVQDNIEMFGDDVLKNHPTCFPDTKDLEKRNGSPCDESDGNQIMHIINKVISDWWPWGCQRIDYTLFSPDEILRNLPNTALPRIFQSSYFESKDVANFIVQQLFNNNNSSSCSSTSNNNFHNTSSSSLSLVSSSRYSGKKCNSIGTLSDSKSSTLFSSASRILPSFIDDESPPNKERWLKRRSTVKVKNGHANHRGNDVIVRDGSIQRISVKFSYGPLDLVTLSGERVGVYVADKSSNSWRHITTCVSDTHGRINVKIDDPPLPYGIHKLRCIVLGDLSQTYVSLACIPPLTECVVFSIDGAFAASMSISGKDPKVKAGAVDVVRFWQDLGYIIIYVSGRPDMQMQKVVTWLSQHNFPHGLVSFADAIHHDPMRHKAEYLKHLVRDECVTLKAAYGSPKDISVYSNLISPTSSIFIVTNSTSPRIMKRAGVFQNSADTSSPFSNNDSDHENVTLVTTGYAEHLATLKRSKELCVKARGNARMFIHRQGSGGSAAGSNSFGRNCEEGTSSASMLSLRGKRSLRTVKSMHS